MKGSPSSCRNPPSISKTFPKLPELRQESAAQNQDLIYTIASWSPASWWAQSLVMGSPRIAVDKKSVCCQPPFPTCSSKMSLTTVWQCLCPFFVSSTHRLATNSSRWVSASGLSHLGSQDFSDPFGAQTVQTGHTDSLRPDRSRVPTCLNCTDWRTEWKRKVDNWTDC